MAEGSEEAGPTTTVYFLFLRWTLVRRSSLRCFFFAIRLRRFLITEPINDPFSLNKNSRRLFARIGVYLLPVSPKPTP